MKKKLLIIGLAVSLVFLITACGNDTSGSSSQNEAAMNTIQPYSLSDEDSEMVSLVAPGAEDAITQFAVDETYKRVCVGYDYYEQGELVKKNKVKSEFPFTYDSGPKDSYGKICTFVDNDDIVVNIYGKVYDKDGKPAEADGLGSKEPLSNEHLTLDDNKDCGGIENTGRTLGRQTGRTLESVYGSDSQGRCKDHCADLSCRKRNVQSDHR